MSDPFRRYLDDLRAAFDEAARHLAADEIRLAVGGVGVRVLVIGERFTEYITTAIGSSEATGDPAITLRVFDSLHSGQEVPPPPWPLSAYVLRDELAGSGSGGVDGACDVSRRVFSLYDHVGGDGVWWARDQDDLAPWDPAAPLRNLAHWALRDHGLQLAHGAVVGRDGHGILLTAKGGSGKSTTTLALLRDGWQFVSDDYCLLATSGAPMAHRIYQVAKGDAGTMARFTDLHAFTVRRASHPGDKSIIDVAGFASDRVVDRLALRAVVIPRIDPDATRPTLRKVSRSAVGRALVPSTLLQLPGCDPDTTARLASATAGLDAFELTLPAELHGLSDTLATLVSDGTAVS